MSQETTSWSRSQKLAFPYIQLGVKQGLTASEALSQYRDGGGAIRDSSWYSLFKQEFAQYGVRENVFKIPMTYTVPETMFDPVDLDYRAKYVMNMKVSGYSSELNTRIVKWVTVESNELLTKSEWRYNAQEAVNNIIGSTPFIIDNIYEWEPRIRIR